MLHMYSRDASARPLMQLEKALKAIIAGHFKPDSTRSGRFVEVPPEAAPMGTEVPLADLVEAK